MSRSTYYYHETHEAADRQSLERPVIREICLGADMRYGYRRVASELKRRTGLCLSGKTVLKVMREEGLTCARRRRRKYRSYAGKVGKVAPNLLGRSFRAAAPMTKLVTDVTELKVAGRKLYLSPVIDLFNDEVVAYSMSTSPNMRMIQEMLEQLEPRIPDGAMPLMHSASRAGSIRCRFTCRRCSAWGSSRACQGRATAWTTRRLRTSSRC